jgi:hypothetical protein
MLISKFLGDMHRQELCVAESTLVEARLADTASRGLGFC